MLSSRFLRLAIVLLCLPLLTVSAWAAPAIEDYGALPAVSMMAVSPDGTLVAFRKHGPDMDLIAVVSLESGEMVQGINMSDLKPRDLYFFNQSKLILVAAEHKRLRGYRRSFDMSTAFLLDLKTGDLEQLLTPGRGVKKGQTGLGNVVGVSKNGNEVYLPAYVGEEHDRSPDRSLVRVELDSLFRPVVEEKGSYHTRDYFLDDDGKLLAEEIFKNRAEYHAIVAHRDGEEVEIFSQDTVMPELDFVGLTPDHKALVVADEMAGRTVYRTMALADGELSEPIFEREDADVERPLQDINRVVHGVVYSGLRPSYGFFDPELTRRMNAIVDQYADHSVTLTSWSADWEHLVVKVEGSTASGIYVLHSKGESARFLASARPNIGDHINPILEFEYVARDGLPIPAILTIPRNRAESLKKLPAVILPHGGPHAHDWIGFDWLAQALSSQGYVVVQPQFRGSTGFGAKHWSAGRGEWGKKMQDDLTDGVKALVQEKVIDPDRVCIVGMSYGGYAALAGGAFTPDLYQCVVSVNGVSDLPQMLSAVRSDYGKYHWLLSYWEDSMIKGEDEGDDLDSVSPVNFADRFRAPVLLIHGEDDRVVRYDQSKDMYRQLRRADKPVELLRLDDEDHYLSRSETRLTTLKAVMEFVETHIGAKALD